MDTSVKDPASGTSRHLKSQQFFVYAFSPAVVARIELLFWLAIVLTFYGVSFNEVRARAIGAFRAEMGEV